MPTAGGSAEALAGGPYPENKDEGKPANALKTNKKGNQNNTLIDYDDDYVKTYSYN